MVEVKFVTSKELVKQMAQQPLALRKRITETLGARSRRRQRRC